MATADTTLPPNQVANLRLIPDKKLLRAGLLMLLFMTASFGAATWNSMQQLATPIKAVPVALFVVVCILVARLNAKVDDIAVGRATTLAAEPELTHDLAPLHATLLAQVPLETRNEVWTYWDRNGTGRQEIERIRRAYKVPDNILQHLLEQYDVRWREQLATMYSANPGNEYTAYAGIDKRQIAEDALRLNSGLPIYPVAGVWLCSACHQRPCRCELTKQKDSSPLQ